MTMHISPTTSVGRIAFVAKLLLASIFQGLEDGLANAFVPPGTRHSINLSEHHARDAVVIVAGERPRNAVTDA